MITKLKNLILTTTLLAVTSSEVKAAVFTFENFLDDRVAAIAFPYGTTNYLTNQTSTNASVTAAASNGGYTNGFVWFQNAYVFPSILQGANYTVVGSPPNGTTLIGGGGNYITNTLINPTNVNPALATLNGSNSFYLQWTAGNTNVYQAQAVPPPVLLSGAKCFADANGQLTSNATVTIVANADAATGTNTFQVTFYRTTPVPVYGRTAPNNPGGIPPNIDVNKTWTVSFTLNGLTPVTVVTNIPNDFMLGASSIVPYTFGSVTNQTSAGKYLGTNVYLTQLSLEGYVP